MESNPPLKVRIPFGWVRCNPNRAIIIITLGPLNASALNFLSEVSRQLTSWRSTRDLFSVPVPLNAYTALQLCSDYGLLLLL